MRAQLPGLAYNALKLVLVRTERDLACRLHQHRVVATPDAAGDACSQTRNMGLAGWAFIVRGHARNDDGTNAAPRRMGQLSSPSCCDEPLSNPRNPATELSGYPSHPSGLDREGCWGFLAIRGGSRDGVV